MLFGLADSIRNGVIVVDPETFDDDKMFIQDAFTLNMANDERVSMRVRHFLAAAVNAHAFVVDGRKYTLPSTRYALVAASRTFGYMVILDGHQKARRLDIVRSLCRHIEEVDRAGSNVIVVTLCAAAAFRSCGDDPFHAQIQQAVREGAYALDPRIAASLSSSGCAVFWKLSRNAPPPSDRILKSPFARERDYGVSLWLKQRIYDRPFEMPLAVEDEDRMLALGYTRVFTESERNLFVSPRIARSASDPLDCTFSMDEVSVACPRREAELRALAGCPRGAARPIAFVGRSAWIIISDHDLFRTVASWYIDDTDNLRIQELAMVVASYAW